MAISASVPTVIAGRYQLGEELGRGGMAEVRAGTDLRLQRAVAVKFLLPAMAAREDIRRRFEAEARSAASLSDPHAVAVYDTGEHEGTPYIVMERLPGETLADRIAAGPVEPAWLRQVACEVLGALGVAHAAGLIHRDVKPGNILLTADGHAKIADFGIAKSLEGSARSLELTGTGQLLGTPAYLAPELLDGATATPRSDLYSLGVVLYEALTGARPFPGDTPLQTARAVVAGEFPPLGQVRPDLDPALVGVVEKAMARDPERRFATAAAMAGALAPPPPTAVAASGTPTLVDGIAGPATSVLDRAELDRAGRGPASGVARPPGPVPPSRVGRPSGRVPVALLVGLVALAVLVFALHNRSKPAGKSTASSTQTSTPATTAGSPGTTAADPATTAPASPTVSLANDLRAAAARLGPADGARAGDLATMLRQVADQVQAGSGGGTATTGIVSVGVWRLTGQLSDAAATSAINLLSRVPGVTVVTLPATPVIPFPTPATTPAPTQGNSNGNGNGKGNGKKG
ncbi:MAG TPA: serine/threonine-protein kinase [Acidimicrobiales bacterium]|nr:serine/threonine-protein kinase [Acidimicrobiales bacterium]